MKTFKFVVGDPEHAGIIRQIIQVCAWIESSESQYLISHKEDQDSLGQMAQSQLSKLRQLIGRLFARWPDADFLIDLREWEYPLDAYCEACGVVRQIEAERGLPEGTLKSRFFVVSTFGNSEDEMAAMEVLEKTETEVKLKSLAGKAGGVESLATMALRDTFDQLLVPA